MKRGVRSFHPLIWLLLVVHCLAPAGVVGQQAVRGYAREAPSQAPIEGAMVNLLSTDADIVGQTLTAADGSFFLPVRAPGSFRLRLDRIGYGSTLSGAFDVASGQVVTVPFDVVAKPVSIQGLDVVGGTRCAVRPGTGEATATVWEEARKALEAARWTSDRELYRFAWMRYVRQIDRLGERIIEEQRSTRRVFTPRPFASASPDSLALYGFLSVEQEEAYYWAPDAEVLLSDAFLDTHCFTLDREVADKRVLLGLRFRPAPDRRLPDVEGVLWLDQASSQLQFLEYDYVNLGRAAAVRGEDASGRLYFRRLPNGTWVVHEWSIRAPQLVEVRDQAGAPRRYDVSGYVEEGGAVTEISTAAGLVLNGSLTAITGVVSDSAGMPAPGARVWLDGSDLSTWTDSDGEFLIEDVGAGTWTILATHPGLSRFGHTGSGATVTVDRNRVRQTSLQLPSLEALALERCGVSEREGGSTTFLGRVSRPDGSPADGAAIRVTWITSTTGLGMSFEGVRTDADAHGVFWACDLPRGQTLFANVSLDDPSLEPSLFTLEDASGAVAVDVRLDEAAAGGPDRREASDNADLRGTAPWLDSLGFSLRRPNSLLHRTSQDIRRLGHSSLAQILGDAPRLQLQRLASGATEFRLHPSADWSIDSGANVSCVLDVYLNGSLVGQPLSRDWETSLAMLIPTEFITALEVYEARNAPVGEPDDCGAVLLWADRMRDRKDPVFTGELRGRVEGLTEMPEGGLSLRLEPGGLEVFADNRGRFDFGPIVPGLYTIEATIPGWGSWTMSVDVRMHSVVDAVVRVGGVASGSASPASVRTSDQNAKEPPGCSQ